MITENLSTLKIHKLTQAQYDREVIADNIDENALYLTPYNETSSITYTTIIPSTNWELYASCNCYFQNITVDGIRESDNPIVGINPSSDDTIADVLTHSNNICKVFHIVTSDNAIQVWATEAISKDLPLQIKVVR